MAVFPQHKITLRYFPFWEQKFPSDHTSPSSYLLQNHLQFLNEDPKPSISTSSIPFTLHLIGLESDIATLLRTPLPFIEITNHHQIALFNRHRFLLISLDHLWHNMVDCPFFPETLSCFNLYEATVFWYFFFNLSLLIFSFQMRFSSSTLFRSCNSCVTQGAAGNSKWEDAGRWKWWLRGGGGNCGGVQNAPYPFQKAFYPSFLERSTSLTNYLWANGSH